MRVAGSAPMSTTGNDCTHSVKGSLPRAIRYSMRSCCRSQRTLT
jgi:hypothetical protein